MNPKVFRVLALIQSDLRRNQSVKQMAQSVQLCASQLRHLFQTELGVSPKRYQQSAKMREAKRLLEHTPLSIKEIANIVGVRDASRFTRSFKVFYGVAPTKYRLATPQPAIVSTTKSEQEIANINEQRFEQEIGE